jgi:hypothetical protein
MVISLSVKRQLGHQTPKAAVNATTQIIDLVPLETEPTRHQRHHTPEVQPNKQIHMTKNCIGDAIY